MMELIHALRRRESEYRAAIDRLLAHVENDPEAYAAAKSLREAVELVGCLRRLIPATEASVKQLHAAFGAPGDFGYETPIGEALAKAYGL